MAKRRPILIGCPNYQVLVPGTYECGPDGQYLLSPEGSFLVERARCGHRGGRCAQTLCVLHRLNRGGKGSWHPSRLVAPPRRSKRRRGPPASGKTSSEAPGGLDLLC